VLEDGTSAGVKTQSQAAAAFAQGCEVSAATAAAISAVISVQADSNDTEFDVA
jgi:mevalonate pyrophosphate decarboxylase